MINKNAITKFTVVDVETPNSYNNSICSIAIIHVEDKQIVYSKSFLVNPEAIFDDFNISIHHVTPKMVENAPTFPVIWNEIKHFFTNGIVIAHNATFDLNVIGKCLVNYDMAIPDFSYLCTLKIARKYMLDKVYGKCTLDALCNAFKIELENHHNAMCDANACKLLYEVLSMDYGISEEDVETYVVNVNKNAVNVRKTLLHKSMNTISGIIFGIGCDNKFKPEENRAICDWMEENKEFKSNSEFVECYRMLEEVLEDGVISIEEYQLLMDRFYIYTTSCTYNESTLSMQILKGIIEGIAVDREVNDEEAQQLYKWMAENSSLKGNYPFDKIFVVLENALENGTIEKNEERELLSIFNQFVKPLQAQDSGIDSAIITEIDLCGKVCCLTGSFDHGAKADIKAVIACKGGTCAAGVNRSVDYLIVGGQGSADWKFGNYGSKVSKALEMQEKGHGIRIVSENVLY